MTELPRQKVNGPKQRSLRKRAWADLQDDEVAQEAMKRLRVGEDNFPDVVAPERAQHSPGEQEDCAANDQQDPA